jgi:hypothetical protein
MSVLLSLSVSKPFGGAAAAARSTLASTFALLRLAAYLAGHFNILMCKKLAE